MKDRAYAKINLALDVCRRREDGYHDINSIMVPINFYDELEINIANENKYECNKPYIWFDENNSIVKMINEVKKRFNINDNYYVKLNKHIPTQAGLGGGTADAASTLRILKRLYDLQLTPEQERQICVSIGADVYFNYFNKPAIVTGIGDKLEPFNIKNEYHILLVKPRLGVSTKQSYENLDLSICNHPDIEKLKKALINGEDIRGLLGNSLEQPAFILNKDVFSIKKTLLECGADNVLMSGSGSCVFAISENEQLIKDLYKEFKNKSYFIRFTKTLTK